MNSLQVFDALRGAFDNGLGAAMCVRARRREGLQELAAWNASQAEIVADAQRQREIDDRIDALILRLEALAE